MLERYCIIIFLTTSHIDVNNDIGLQLVTLALSPFLNSAFISEYFSRVGKTPAARNLLQISYWRANERCIDF
jgi:hypothetical protein